MIEECMSAEPSPKDLGAAAKPTATTSAPGRWGMTYRQLLWLCLVSGFIAGYTVHRSSWQEPATLAEIYARQILAAMEPE